MHQFNDPLESSLPEPWSSRVVAFRSMQGSALHHSVRRFFADLEEAADAGDPEASMLFNAISAAICVQLEMNDLFAKHR
jgi:hypothetical protein